MAKKGTKKNFGAKAAFIRSMPGDMSAKAVVAEAAKAGLKLTEGHVYNVRSTSKTKPAVKAKPYAAAAAAPAAAVVAPRRKPGRPPKAKPAVAAAAPASSGGATEGDLRRAIAEIGLARARAVFAQVEAAFGGR